MGATPPMSALAFAWQGLGDFQKILQTSQNILLEYRVRRKKYDVQQLM